MDILKIQKIPLVCALVNNITKDTVDLYHPRTAAVIMNTAVCRQQLLNMLAMNNATISTHFVRKILQWFLSFFVTVYC